MLQLKEVKETIIAGSAIQTFDFFIQWHLTERCNLRCRHCYQGPRRPLEMTAGEVCDEIDGAVRMFRAWESEQDVRVSPSIHFTGGEPLLYRGFWDVVRHARVSGCRVAVMTNGCLVTDEEARRFRDLDVSEIQVSLEGPPALHDSIRGEGSFLSALRAAERLARAGNCVSANVTLSRLNAPLIEETVKIARDAGFGSIGFSRLVPCGSGGALLESVLSPGEVRGAYEKVLSLDAPGFPVVSGDPLAGTLRGGAPPADCGLTLSGCSAGFSGVTIASDGAVMPCRRIGISVGNLRRKSLRDIWATSRTLWRLRDRSSYRGHCGSCSYWPSCRGCRAVAYAWSRARGRADLFADDPQCWRIGD
ncbi:MAG: radical SAM protein [Pseudomonadota bacterium]|jgi:radical SAM protein with 4Fe4S-binding SPASM domain|nr:radical SAM protein [Syntrophaceae bacterium]MDI9554969.1 radical SAM protein [Pseudomonadota bacterium]NLX30412.1 radical SAM protein [Deltaproteobacteria bacterium]HNU85828.1 radical SAM protein [Syntrophales bacterium]HNZ34822.1 radical SAM protein [Syntrophales bacterium]